MGFGEWSPKDAGKSSPMQRRARTTTFLVRPSMVSAMSVQALGSSTPSLRSVSAAQSEAPRNNAGPPVATGDGAAGMARRGVRNVHGEEPADILLYAV